MKTKVLPFFLWVFRFLAIVAVIFFFIQVPAFMRSGETVRYPVDTLHYIGGIGDSPLFTLEEAVSRSAFIAVCEVTDISPAEPLFVYDEVCEIERRNGVFTPATLTVETLLKGAPGQTSAIYYQRHGAYIERTGNTWDVYYYRDTTGPAPVSIGNRLLVFLQENGQPTFGLMLIPLRNEEALDLPGYLLYEKESQPDLSSFLDEIRLYLNE